MGQSRPYCQYPIACLSLWIEPAIRHNQIRFFFLDEGTTAVGYVTWARLAADTEHRLIHDPSVLLHLSEWNEGDRLWILDFVLLKGNVRSRLREIESLFAHEERINFLRRNDDGTVRSVGKRRPHLLSSISCTTT